MCLKSFVGSKDTMWIDPRLASERLHQIKAATGRGPDDNVLFDLSGGVYDPINHTWLGSLTEGGASRVG